MAAPSQPLQNRDPNAAPPTPSTSNKDLSKSKPPQNKKSTPSKQKEKPPSAADLAHIHIDGEEAGNAPIFDTCDDVRKKINEHLKGPITQAAFAQELSEMIPSDSVKPRQLASFLKFKGPRAGAHSPAFYAAYLYFEKLRLYKGKKKSSKREKLEEAWNESGGFPREGSHNVHMFCVAGESWKFDYLGQIQIRGTPSLTSGQIMRKKASSR